MVIDQTLTKALYGLALSSLDPKVPHLDFVHPSLSGVLHERSVLGAQLLRLNAWQTTQSKRSRRNQQQSCVKKHTNSFS